MRQFEEMTSENSPYMQHLIQKATNMKSEIFMYQEKQREMHLLQYYQDYTGDDDLDPESIMRGFDDQIDSEIFSEYQKEFTQLN